MVDPERLPDKEDDKRSEEEILETGQSREEIRLALQEAMETGREVVLLHITPEGQRVAHNSIILEIFEDAVDVESYGFYLGVELDSIKGVILK